MPSKEKTKVIIALIIFFIFFLYYASLVPAETNLTLCQEETDYGSIPCYGLTPVINCSGNVSVINLNTTAMYNLSTTPVGDGTYNFTFNQGYGSYSLLTCNNFSASIVVGNFAGGFGAINLALLIPFIILIFSSVFVSKKLAYPNGSERPPTTSGFIFGAFMIIVGYLMVIFMTGFVNAQIGSYIPNQPIVSIYDWFINILFYMFIALIFFFLAMTIYYVIENKNINKLGGLEEGLVD